MPDSSAATAIEKSVALIGVAAGRAMDSPCPHCRGGWWADEGELTYAAHDASCPMRDASESEVWAVWRAT